MKVRYRGESFGVFGLMNGKVYECLGVEIDGLLRIVDDEGPSYWEKTEGEEEGYLYSCSNPAPMDGSSPGGKWEIVEDDENGTLKKLIG